MAGPGAKPHHERDRGGGLLEYAAIFAVVAVLIGGVIVAVPGLGGTMSEEIGRRVCLALGGEHCDEPAPPEQAGSQSPEGAPSSSPGSDFFESGFDSLADSARNAACLAGVCGGEEFVDSWHHAAHAFSPFAEEVRPCPDWAMPEGVTSYRPDGQPSRADGTLREEQTIGTFNMAGSAMNDAEDGVGTEDDTVVDAIVRSVEDRRPTFLALQEVCSNQAYALAGELDGYDVHFAPVQKMNADGSVEFQRCGANGALYGNAVLYRMDVAEDIHGIPYQAGGGTRGGAGYDLGTPDLTDGDGELRGHEKRGMACVASARQQVAFCSTHLTHDSSEATRAETERINQIMEEEYPGYTVLIGGDFNARPHEEAMGAMYHEEYGFGADGELKEVDSVGQSGFFGSCRGGGSTHGWGLGPFGDRKKIDYIFVSQDVEIHGAEATHSDHSDHDPLWSDVTF